MSKVIRRPHFDAGAARALVKTRGRDVDLIGYMLGWKPGRLAGALAGDVVLTYEEMHQLDGYLGGNGQSIWWERIEINDAPSASGKPARSPADQIRRADAIDKLHRAVTGAPAARRSESVQAPAPGPVEELPDRPTAAAAPTETPRRLSPKTEKAAALDFLFDSVQRGQLGAR